MMNFGALNWFDSFIKKLKKSIVLYQQPCDLHLWQEPVNMIAVYNTDGSIDKKYA